MREFLLQSKHDTLDKFLDQLDHYLSQKCTSLTTPSQVTDGYTNLVYYRVDYHHFSPEPKSSSYEESNEFIRIAGKVRPEYGNYMTLEPTIVKAFRDWMCGQTVDGRSEGKCFGVCIVSAQLRMIDLSASPMETMPISPLIFIMLHSPVTGKDVQEHLINVENRSISFIMPLVKNVTGSSSEIKCARLDLDGLTWDMDACQTIYSSPVFLVCKCNELGYFGYVHHDIILNLFYVNFLANSALEIEHGVDQPTTIRSGPIEATTLSNIDEEANKNYHDNITESIVNEQDSTESATTQVIGTESVVTVTENENLLDNSTESIDNYDNSSSVISDNLKIDQPDATRSSSKDNELDTTETGITQSDENVAITQTDQCIHETSTCSSEQANITQAGEVTEVLSEPSTPYQTTLPASKPESANMVTESDTIVTENDSQAETTVAPSQQDEQDQTTIAEQVNSTSYVIDTTAIITEINVNNSTELNEQVSTAPESPFAPTEEPNTSGQVADGTTVVTIPPEQATTEQANIITEEASQQQPNEIPTTTLEQATEESEVG